MTTTTKPGIRTALTSLFSVFVKACTQAESIMDVSQDIIDTAKTYSDQMKQEAKIEAEKQLKLMQAPVEKQQPKQS